MVKRFKCEADYAPKYNTGTADHIAFSMWVSTLVCFVGVFWLPALYAYPLIWFYYAPFKELVIDRKKQKHQPKEFVKAQILERTSGFVIMLPAVLAVLIKWFL